MTTTQAPETSVLMGVIDRQEDELQYAVAQLDLLIGYFDGVDARDYVALPGLRVSTLERIFFSIRGRIDEALSASGDLAILLNQNRRATAIGSAVVDVLNSTDAGVQA